MKNLFLLLSACLLHIAFGFPAIDKDAAPVLTTDPFIVNGDNARHGDFPHQLMMEKSSSGSWRFACGAVIINNLQALTAAHCVEGSSARAIRLVAGLYNINDRKDTQIVVASKVAIHPKYNDGTATFNDDIAILTFSEPLTFTKYVQPIEWNGDDEVTFAGKRCVLSGWGKTEGNFPSVLQRVTMDVITNNQCQQLGLPSSVIYGGHICAYEPNFGSCSGDSGGPMTCEHEGKQILAGVTSWGVSNFFGCVPTYPSVYARTSYFRQFIIDNLVE